MQQVNLLLCGKYLYDCHIARPRPTDLNKPFYNWDKQCGTTCSMALLPGDV
jgi:hypothetical protein